MPDFAGRASSDPPVPPAEQPVPLGAIQGAGPRDTESTPSGRSGRCGVWSWDVASGIVDRTHICSALHSPQTADQPTLDLPDDLHGFLQAIHPEDRARVSDAIDSALEGAGDFDVIYRVRTDSGGERWLHDRGDVFRGPTGQALRLVAITTETAPPVQSRPTAASPILEGLPVPALCLRENGLNECNDAWTAATGLGTADVAGVGWLLALHEEDRDRVKRAAKGAARGHAGPAIEGRLKHPSGDDDWYVFTIRPAHQADLANGLLVLATNVDSLKQAHLDANSSNERLRAALTEGHHRIKNNLQTITALIELHLAETRETVPASVLHRLSQNIKSLAGLHELLTSQAKASNHGDTGELIEAKEALSKLLPLLEGATGDRPLEMSCADVMLTLRQATGLTLLVTELVSNASKHGRGTIRVTLLPGDAWGPGVERRSSPRARLEVTDEGDGFPPGFDPATQAHTGLELVQMLARWDLGGQVFFANTRDGGARVVVTFAAAGPLAPVKPVPRRRTFPTK